MGNPLSCQPGFLMDLPIFAVQLLLHPLDVIDYAEGEMEPMSQRIVWFIEFKSTSI
jgi:hypothetical protein